MKGGWNDAARQDAPPLAPPTPQPPGPTVYDCRIASHADGEIDRPRYREIDDRETLFRSLAGDESRVPGLGPRRT